ncbi:MAG TPA: TerC family protein [Pseudolabrys sp.]|jgi:YjbE family integral membrane protein|nr:TerC family protein [Pseudolabrys sp.]
MADLFTQASLVAFLQVIMIDLVLAGDNAVVIGLAAAGLPPEQRSRAILVGILGATVLRIAFALFIVQLMAIVGLVLAGGILLLWVSWKMWRELRRPKTETADSEPRSKAKTFGQAVWQIVVADISMSLDNALAVAGAARDHLPALMFGLILSVALMGFAATLVARLLERYRWIAYIGLAIVLYVAVDMIWRGALEIHAYAF